LGKISQQTSNSKNLNLAADFCPSSPLSSLLPATSPWLHASSPIYFLFKIAKAN